MTRILTAMIFSLGLGTAAIAQSTPGVDAGAGAGATVETNAAPSNWDAEVSGAFFSDMEAGTLRSSEEISTNWADLSADQQAAVRADCQNIETADAGMEAIDRDATGDDLTTSSVDGGTMQTSMVELCGWVNQQ